MVNLLLGQTCLLVPECLQPLLIYISGFDTQHEVQGGINDSLCMHILQTSCWRGVLVAVVQSLDKRKRHSGPQGKKNGPSTSAKAQRRPFS